MAPLEITSLCIYLTSRHGNGTKSMIFNDQVLLPDFTKRNQKISSCAGSILLTLFEAAFPCYL